MNLPAISTAVLKLLIYDLIFVTLLLVLVSALSKSKLATFAVMKRNFIGYFSNPTGYVFLCIFVFLTSVAAFWPYQFFNQNLATLDQLNQWFPLIMLVFIPAITMSIWADEKRQGTDELLLTLPADDFDIVIGKYMAAAAIFTASLLFSQLSTFMTLAILTQGMLDTGLIFTTYLGYWFVGLMMIAIGMIASFLTGNLTVGFILGALFNAPLAFAAMAKSVLPGQSLANLLGESGIARPFDDFGRGVISLSSVVYFVLAATVALYLCMVLIGRRHWTGGKDGNTMAWHYLLRTVALIAITGGAVVVFRNWDLIRYDTTENKTASLAPATKTLIRELDSRRPIVIDAFISDDVPEQYAKTRYELINLLKEFRSEASKRGRQIEVNLYDGIELFSDEADLARERFEIVPVDRMVYEKGAYQQKQLIMGAAFRSGLQSLTIPIFEYGVPVEYELVRSINTVARGDRKRIGVVATEARMMGGAVMAGMNFQQVPKHPLVQELEKQYEVEAVTLDGAVTPGQFDALVAVQPSSLDPEQFGRLVEAIRAGVPTAIFEDPFSFGQSFIPGTGEPKQSPGGMFGGGGPQPKGNIRDLWELLEIDVPGTPSMAMPGLFNPSIVWQQWNPYPNLEMNANSLWLFIDVDAPLADQPLNEEHPITSGMRQVLSLYAGSLNPQPGSRLTHTPLLRTSGASGVMDFEAAQRVASRQSSPMREEGNATGSSAIAMAIEGKLAAAAPAEGEAATEPVELKVVYVSDIDMMLPVFLQLRAEPDQAPDTKFQFQNVTFLLNAIDYLADELDYVEIRKHEPGYSGLKMIAEVKERASSEVRERGKEFQDNFDALIRDEQEKMEAELKSLRDEMTEMQRRSADGTVSRAVAQEKLQQFQIKREARQRALDVRRVAAERQRDQSILDIQRDADKKVTQMQNQVKWSAAILPVIPPLIVGVIVFASRRLRERENISKSRLK
ncbi:MAG: ABC transporter permease [Planctomycetaceae bacterium]|nr:MAG: ABC transporter permease [Planctomycetaceae bacterium]